MIYTITEMTEKHYNGKAHVQYTAWSETYRGLMPNEYLDSRTFMACYKSTLEHPQNTYVALVGETVVGFIWYSPEARDYTHRTGMSEINALYVLKKYQHLGIGKALMEKALSMLPHKTAVLYVLQSNTPAIIFYEHMGFKFTGNTFTPVSYTHLIMVSVRGSTRTCMPVSSRIFCPTFRSEPMSASTMQPFPWLTRLAISTVFSAI